MPDLYSHTALACALPARWRFRVPLFAFAAGSVIPDVLGYVPMKLVYALQQIVPVPKSLIHISTPWHSPAVFIPACYLICLLFEEKERKPLFLGLTAGSLFHLALDLIQRNMDGGYLVFFPFYLEPVQIGLVWADRWPYLAAAATVLLSIKIIWKVKSKPGFHRQGRWI